MNFLYVGLLVVGVYFLCPLITNILYEMAMHDYEARRKRSVPITATNVWLGLFVESWDGQPPKRWEYRLCGNVIRWGLIGSILVIGRGAGQ